TRSEAPLRLVRRAGGRPDHNYEAFIEPLDAQRHDAWLCEAKRSRLSALGGDNRERDPRRWRRRRDHPIRGKGHARKPDEGLNGDALLGSDALSDRRVYRP